MRNNCLAFALFAALILLSMMREWSMPIACARSVLASAATLHAKH